MVQPDTQFHHAGFPPADALSPFQRPAFDSNRRWYDEYLNMMRRANDLVIDTVQLLRQIDPLHQALVTVLEETNGGSFLSGQTRDSVQELVQQHRVGIPTGLHMDQQR
jgi:type VI protein secretion system component VasA